MKHWLRTGMLLLAVLLILAVPSMDAQQRISLLKGWNKAVVRAKRWVALEDEE